MKVQCLFFASLKEAIQSDELTVELESATVRQVMDYLNEHYPDAAPFLARAHIALNEEYCSPDSSLKEGDTLAFIPPVSGGAL